MAYRPPTWTPTTRWARRLDEVMRERGWSKVQLFEAIGADLPQANGGVGGYSPKSRTAIYPLLKDTDPTDEQAAVLVRHFGELPPEPVTAPVEPTPDLAIALVGLTRELEAWRLERQTMQDQIAELQATVAAHDLRLGSTPSEGGTGSREAPKSPPETTGSGR